VREIIPLSVARTWNEAKQEWELVHVFYTDGESPGTCLCGHYPIIKHCVLRNRENGNEVRVGSCCVKRFLGLPADAIFRCLERIARDPEASLNPVTVEYAYDRGWMTPWERDFYLDTLSKRRLSARQRAKREEIKSAVLGRGRIRRGSAGGPNDASY
jgi:hypothetical protein